MTDSTSKAADNAGSVSAGVKSEHDIGLVYAAQSNHVGSYQII